MQGRTATKGTEQQAVLAAEGGDQAAHAAGHFPARVEATPRADLCDFWERQLVV